MTTKQLVIFFAGIAVCGGMLLAYLWLAASPPGIPALSAKAASVSAQSAPAAATGNPAGESSLAERTEASWPPSRQETETNPAALRLSRLFQQAFLKGGPQLAEAMKSVLPAWVAADPAAAANYAEKLEPGFERDRVLHRVAELWGIQDPERALEWASQRTNSLEAQGLVSSICVQEAQANPQAALSTAERFGLTETNAPVVDSLVAKWANTSESAALAWAASQPESDRRSDLITLVALAQSVDSPFAASQLVLNNIPPGPQQNKAMVAVLHEWEMRDTKVATAWVEQLPSDNPLRTQGESEIKLITR